MQPLNDITVVSLLAELRLGAAAVRAARDAEAAA